MAETVAAISAWWAALGSASAGAAGAGAGAGAVGAGVGGGAVGAGVGAGAAAAGTAGGLSATATAAITAGVSAAGALAAQVLAPKPDKISAPPVIQPVDIPPPKKTPTDPGNVPGSQNKNFGAGAAEEKRRILSAMPSAIQTTYAGNKTGVAPVNKKRLLGAGITGRDTTGA